MDPVGLGDSGGNIGEGGGHVHFSEVPRCGGRRDDEGSGGSITANRPCEVGLGDSGGNIGGEGGGLVHFPEVPRCGGRRDQSINRRVDMGSGGNLMACRPCDNENSSQPINSVDVSLNNCAKHLSRFSGRILSAEEWAQFEEVMDGLVRDLKNAAPVRRSQHPTSHWKGRRRKSGSPQNSGSRPSLSAHPEDSAPTCPVAQTRVSFSVESNHDQRSNHPSSQRGGRRQHNRSERRQRAREAGKLQKFYRANKKKCIRSIIWDQSPRCEIPLDVLADHFGEESSHSTGSPPDFLPVRRNIFDSK